MFTQCFGEASALCSSRAGLCVSWNPPDSALPWPSSAPPALNAFWDGNPHGMLVGFAAKTQSIQLVSLEPISAESLEFLPWAAPVMAIATEKLEAKQCQTQANSSKRVDPHGQAFTIPIQNNLHLQFWTCWIHNNQDLLSILVSHNQKH